MQALLQCSIVLLTLTTHYRTDTVNLDSAWRSKAKETRAAPSLISGVFIPIFTTMAVYSC